MLIDELVHTCSHEDVARAAVFSLGLSFAGKVASAAQFHDISVGAFAAKAISHFAVTAPEDEKRSLSAVMDAAEQPLLAGFHFILAPILEAESRAMGYAAAKTTLGLSSRAA